MDRVREAEEIFRKLREGTENGLEAFEFIASSANILSLISDYRMCEK